MPSRFYRSALSALLTGTLSLTNDTLLIMLVDADYEMDEEQASVDLGSPDDLASHEIADVTNYSRKTPVITSGVDEEGRPYLRFNDLSWPNLGGTTNGIIGGVALIRQGEEDDATAMPIAFFSQTPKETNGGTFTVDFEDDYQIRVSQSSRDS